MKEWLIGLSSKENLTDTNVIISTGQNYSPLYLNIPLDEL